MSALAKVSLSAGPFVVIVGPSGVGKDALIRGLASRLGEDDGVFAVRRVVTRARRLSCSSPRGRKRSRSDSPLFVRKPDGEFVVD
jgi:ribose 1,5-bisphosphokinase PhnN